MPNNNKLLILGEVYVDVHLDTPCQLSRLGGIFHSARAMHALQKSFAIAAISPEYLEQDIIEYAAKFGASQSSIIGKISRCPNVMLINESTEAGDQGYNDILINQAESSLNANNLKEIIEDYEPTDILIYPGKYNLLDVLDHIKDYKCRIHIDFQYDSNMIIDLNESIKFDNIILSTSSKIFIDHCAGNSGKLVKLLKSITNGILLKENRGGSRYFSYANQSWEEAPAFLINTVHSVGVGDVFNAVFVTSNENINISLKLASYTASWYASTFNHDSFISNVQSLTLLKEQIIELTGVRIGWEERRNCHIYIAGPDFPHINTKPIEDVYDSLSYHNFSPRRPILENGLITGEESEGKQLEVYAKDLDLLKECSLLVAVLINDDPGTYVEIGWMANGGKPTILFDPYNKADNLFLEKTVSKICNTLTEVVDSVFEYLGNEGVEKA